MRASDGHLVFLVLAMSLKLVLVVQMPFSLHKPPWGWPPFIQRGGARRHGACRHSFSVEGHAAMGLAAIHSAWRGKPPWGLPPSIQCGGARRHGACRHSFSVQGQAAMGLAATLVHRASHTWVLEQIAACFSVSFSCLYGQLRR